MKKINFTLPAWAAQIVANAEFNGLSDADLLAWSGFETSLQTYGRGRLVLGDENGFGRKNDVDGFAGDTYQAAYILDKSPVQIAFEATFRDVGSRWGAPMGRRDRGKLLPDGRVLHDTGKCSCSTGIWGMCSECPKPEPIKARIYDRYLPMDSQGYDRGGAYWGIGPRMRVRFTACLSFVEYYREGDT